MWRKYNVMTVYFLSQLQRWMGIIRSARVQKSVTVMWRKYQVMMVYFLSQLQRWMGMIRSARECVCYRYRHVKWEPISRPFKHSPIEIRWIPLCNWKTFWGKEHLSFPCIDQKFFFSRCFPDNLKMQFGAFSCLSSVTIIQIIILDTVHWTN